MSAKYFVCDFKMIMLYNSRWRVNASCALVDDGYSFSHGLCLINNTLVDD